MARHSSLGKQMLTCLVKAAGDRDALRLRARRACSLSLERKGEGWGEGELGADSEFSIRPTTSPVKFALCSSTPSTSAVVVVNRSATPADRFPRGGLRSH